MLIHKKKEPINDILERINQCPTVQKYMDATCTDLSILLDTICHSYTPEIHTKILLTQSNTRYCNDKVDNEKMSYDMVQRFVLNIVTQNSRRKSGFVGSSDIKDVLLNGNIRERCLLFSTIIARDKYYFLLIWLITVQEDTLPHTINKESLMSLRKLFVEGDLEKPTLQVVTYNKSYGLAYTNKKNCRLTNKIFNEFKCARMDVRQLRQDNNKDSITGGLIPELSGREEKQINTEIKPGHIPWQCGKQKWVPNPNHAFCKFASQNNQEIFCGPSASTLYLYMFMSIFKKYDPDITMLVNCVWLVASGHHSLFEVLISSASYMTKTYHPSQDPIEYIEEVIQHIQYKSTNVTPDKVQHNPSSEKFIENYNITPPWVCT